MSEEQIEVDLTPDDATLSEAKQDEPDDAPPEMKGTAPDAEGPGPDRGNELEVTEEHKNLEKAVEEEAKHRLANAEGEDRLDRVDNAVEEAVESLQQNTQQLQQLKQQKQQAENRIERLEMTKERVIGQPDSNTIMQTLAGGVSLEVPPAHGHVEEYNREDLIDEIDETIEALKEQVENVGGQIESLEESLQQTQLATKELKKSTGLMEVLDE